MPVYLNPKVWKPMKHEIAEAIGLDGEVAALCAKNPQVVVFTYAGRVSNEHRKAIFHAWNEAVAGTSLEHVKAILLDGGLQLSIVDHVPKHENETRYETSGWRTHEPA